MQNFYSPSQKLAAFLFLGLLRILSAVIAAALLPYGYAPTLIPTEDDNLIQGVLIGSVAILSTLVLPGIFRKDIQGKTNLRGVTHGNTDSLVGKPHTIDILKHYLPVERFLSVLSFTCGFLSTFYLLFGYDQVPLFISSHPTTTFVPVSGLYGPGAWLALLGTTVVMMVPLVRGAVSQTSPTTWSPELVTLVVYTLTASYDLISKHEATFKEPERIDITLFPSLVAATRATAFGAGILEICTILLLISHNRNTSYVATFQLLLAWGSSVVALVVMCPLTKEWDCKQDSQSCISLAPSHAFRVREHRDAIVAVWAYMLRNSSFPFHFPASEQETPISVLVAFMAFVVALKVGRHAAPGLARFLWTRVFAFTFAFTFACISAFAFFYLTPLVLTIGGLLIVDMALYRFICLVSLLPVLVLSAIPGQSLFPYSGISIREIDQMSALLALILYNIFQHGHRIFFIIPYLKKMARSRTGRPEEEQINLEALPSRSSLE